MEARYPSQNNIIPVGKNHALPQSHPCDMCSSKPMEGVPIPKTGAPARNFRGLPTSSDTPKITPHCKSSHSAPLEAPSPKGPLRKREAGHASILTTIQPLSMESKPHRDPAFLSPLQSIQRKARWSPATTTWKESAAKVSRCSSSKGPGNTFYPHKFLDSVVVLHHPLMPIPRHREQASLWMFMSSATQLWVI